MYNKKHRVLVQLIITFILSICLYAPVLSAQTGQDASLINTGGIIIIDAGSTGTRLHLFKYKVHPYDPSHIIWIKEVLQKRVTPGLATVAIATQKLTDKRAQQQQIRQYISPLLHAASEKLTPAQRNNTPVYLFATAGVRNLSNQNREHALTLTKDVLLADLAQAGYPTPDANPHHAVNAINGSAEGLFSWISINHLMQRYDAQDFTAHRTYGVLDLGGASTQISTQQDNIAKAKDSMYLQGQTKQAIYVHSYPVYGAYFSQMPFKQHYGRAANVCFLRSNQANFDQCQKLIADYMYNNKAYNRCVKDFGATHCAKMGQYQPDISHTQFFIISNYYDIFARLHLIKNIPSPAMLAKAGQSYCAMKWKTARAQYPKRDQQILDSDCFVSAWAYTLIKGYGLHDDTPLLVSDKIGNVSTDWPLGAAIYLISQPRHDQSIYLA